MDNINIENDAASEIFNKKIEEARKTEAEMRHRIGELEKLSVTDGLTGAWNRTYFDKIFTIEMSRSTRYHQPLTVIIFDIDNFKQVNDNHGHGVGDTVLRELVKLVSMNIRVSDMLFRWGGEEFVILMPSTSYHDATSLIETLRTKVEQHTFDIVGNISLSIGVAEYISGESENVCFQRADAAMYAAKNSGRNRVVVDPRGSSDLWATDKGAMILFLNWDESYCCSEPTIDQQHKKLFELSNVLIEAAFTRHENPQNFNSALEKLLAHVVQHFSDEEAILAKYHYVDIDKQIREHKVLTEHALQLRDKAKADTVTIGELVDFFVDEVVVQHMFKVDREFFQLFSKLLHH